MSDAGQQEGRKVTALPHQSQLTCEDALVLAWLFQGRLDLFLEWT